jgi:hypothetical protein
VRMEGCYEKGKGDYEKKTSQGRMKKLKLKEGGGVLWE